ncbi:hypothetical protein [Aquifex aeolicus]|uniref:hypothetical protein n=1 Tax=Aquifex aeolicus TaxID=63363 RepID=UPI0013E8CF8C|nr:hypothetical protein [Aquifex aeolicus]
MSVFVKIVMMHEKLERICSVIEHYLSDILGRIRVYRDEANFLIPWGSTVINVNVFGGRRGIH